MKKHFTPMIIYIIALINYNWKSQIDQVCYAMLTTRFLPQICQCKAIPKFTKAVMTKYSSNLR